MTRAGHPLNMLLAGHYFISRLFRLGTIDKRLYLFILAIILPSKRVREARCAQKLLNRTELGIGRCRSQITIDLSSCPRDLCAPIGNAVSWCRRDYRALYGRSSGLPGPDDRRLFSAPDPANACSYPVNYSTRIASASFARQLFFSPCRSLMVFRTCFYWVQWENYCHVLDAELNNVKSPSS